ncbi:hypothetical protein PNEG_00269 [Pneumocystis murina B123]|uniref:C2H2-type domain-containing protein n=1 Tax=Pneumocystis murina (strain B123) TaxID=1069680 RepID=M7NX34_PNEMU|nr:hypothetical protein PNEG_00269 [Pneumocystis murina B123]EMR11847.1 hypothetical protein PNEG_00269 [Pneumocystis murina B123]
MTQLTINCPSSKNGLSLFDSQSSIQNSSVSKTYQDNCSSISSDTSGSLPDVPREKSSIAAVCKWNRCFKDQGSLENLVNHLYYVHIGNTRTTYICEWDHCSRKKIVPMSRFALFVHLRSHIGEKLFFCRVPECQKLFARFDNLENHMKIVHYLDFISSSTLSSHIQNPYSETHFISNKDVQNFLLKNEAKYFCNKEFTENSQDESTDFLEEESVMSFYDLSKLLKQKLHWIKEKNQRLKSELHRAQKRCKRYYIQKEGAFEKLLIKSLGKNNAASIIR